jgi:hypothetical protein
MAEIVVGHLGWIQSSQMPPILRVCNTGLRDNIHTIEQFHSKVYHSESDKSYYLKNFEVSIHVRDMKMGL